METIEQAIFYIGIAAGECAGNSKRLKKEGMPILKMEKKLPFYGGRLQVYSSLLPEFSGQSFFRKKNKEWKQEHLFALLKEAGERAENQFQCGDILFAPALWSNLAQEEQTFPLELWKAALYRHKPFHRLCVSLPGEGDAYPVEEVEELLAPYLPRLHQVTYAGRACRRALMLEEYLYEEFGMIMTMAARPPKNMLWLDLRSEAERNSAPWQEFCNNKCVNPAQTLKFLDTMAKNGYNTKVN